MVTDKKSLGKNLGTMKTDDNVAVSAPMDYNSNKSMNSFEQKLGATHEDMSAYNTAAPLVP